MTIQNLSTFKGPSNKILNSSLTTLTTTVSGHTSSISTLTSQVSTINTTVGSPTSSATASQIILRDANGRAQVNDPSVNKDIANLEWVNGAIASAVSSIGAVLTVNGTTETGNWTASANTHNTVDLSAGNSNATLPLASTCIGEEIEIFISAIASAGAGTYSLTWTPSSSSGTPDVIQASISGLTDLYGCVVLRAIKSGLWRLVSRS